MTPARFLMGTIFLVYRNSRLNRPESVSLASLARQLDPSRWRTGSSAPYYLHPRNNSIAFPLLILLSQGRYIHFVLSICPGFDSLSPYIVFLKICVGGRKESLVLASYPPGPHIPVFPVKGPGITIFCACA